MRKILVTGGTVFVSRFVANYFKNNNEVYVLNRNSRPQLDGVHLIEGDRHQLGERLRAYHFDAVIDVCAYNGNDISCLLDALNPVEDYVLISSSAVYPETNPQPFTEEQEVGVNHIWGDYGTNKIEAETVLRSRMPSAYILRPPYLYGPMQNLYREPFVFECAMKNRPFYVPKNGEMKLQFFHVEDLCKMIEKLWELHPDNHIYNVGNPESVDIRTLVELCYQTVGKQAEIKPVFDQPNQRDYFCFHDYEYALDVQKQSEILPETKSLQEGLKEEYLWYKDHIDQMFRKNYIEFIDEHLK